MMQPDWHSADIIAALKKRGTTLSAVSREAGLASSTLANTLIRHWPKGEKLIAEAVGVPPEQIWPSRYR
ncbi:helix-turn-helix transcriptional regulator [Hafnia alvei]|uniref:helix-turn-helix domain-containing protein n=1 Tax=Hafnia alvei TaxID=569 RepID=UPI0028BF5718|nr:helix-turn-helix transcriptional regulator [Hafnia alvei]WNN53251.1 helix-turn-helix transcriptional regulator [Hafnia alvei]